jgi:hypothetical protein
MCHIPIVVSFDNKVGPENITNIVPFLNTLCDEPRKPEKPLTNRIIMPANE